MSRKFVYYGAGKSASLDPDALAFLTATAITDPTITGAIDTLVKDLKAQSLWSKFRYIYPFVGGTATTNKYNLKDPRDLDVAFRLTFFGGITHSGGFNPNGTNGYANTFCSPSGNVILNSEHVYMTSNTNNTPIVANNIDCGAFNSLSQLTNMVGKRNNQFFARMNSSLVTTANTNAEGSYCATKNQTTDLRIFKNGSFLENGVSTGSLPTVSIFLAALNINNNPVGNSYNNQNYTFATYGDGLSDTDVANLTSIEEAFNTTLGR